ncbi:MAG: hypothetical protein OEV64_05355 [Desulfobulbaceae bacterium]|nr:hypothetical protein [Desulfobulbaceae bacterium]
MNIRQPGHGLLITLLSALIILSQDGCITTVEKPNQPNSPPLRSFSNFEQVAVKHISSAKKKSNDYTVTAIEEVDTHLTQCLRSIFPNLSIFEQSPLSLDENTLVISPLVRDIKCVSPTERLWAAAFAGSSAINIQVTFTDGKGELVAQPTFYTTASAHMGVSSSGDSDRKILKDIAQDICGYILFNR